MPKFSVIIPSYGRSESLYECKESLYNQTNQDFEIITIKEEGPLAKIRNIGAKRASGKYLCFIDDDVVCSPHWLESLQCAFGRGFKGVTGPSIVKGEHRKNRDCFKFPVHWFSSKRPGVISAFGQWSLESCKEGCSYEGPVDYLEACNMSFESKAFWSVNGFDEQFGGVGDWSEPDLCFRLRAEGHNLWFSRDAVVEHRPSKSGAYKKRLVKCDRMENYLLFSERWISPSFRHTFYKFVMRTYFKLKEGGHV
jgi:GT2 family glycosyltransferase